MAKLKGEKVKIRLLEDLPVDPSHKALEGNIYDAELAEVCRGAPRYWIIGATGKRVGVLNHEADFVIEGDE